MRYVTWCSKLKLYAYFLFYIILPYIIGYQKQIKGGIIIIKKMLVCKNKRLVILFTCICLILCMPVNTFAQTENSEIDNYDILNSKRLEQAEIFFEEMPNQLPDKVEETGDIEPQAIIWNPLSLSVSSGCLGSACAGSGCLGSACAASGCAGSGCAASGCGGSACTGSGCGGSACGGSACAGSACVGSGCLGSVCVGSGCAVSYCVGTACIQSVCAGSACVVSACVGSTCAGSACYASACGIPTSCINCD